jgi:glyoxylase-like metal-dependent hydrolase (beta-lactamase superfamily II)
VALILRRYDDRMNEVITGVYQLPNSFVNMYLILEPDGLTLIDAGVAKSGAKVVLDALQKLGRPPSDLKRILITHADPDHIGSVAALKAATGAQVVIGRGEAAAMAAGKPSRPPKNPVVRLMIGLMMKIEPLKTDVELEDGAELPVLGGLRVIASPGHTRGHVAYFSPRDRILFAGDAMLVSKGKLSWSDGPFTQDYAEGLRTVRKLEGLNPSVVCCGHGNPVRADAAKGERLEFPS